MKKLISMSVVFLLVLTGCNAVRLKEVIDKNIPKESSKLIDTIIIEDRETEVYEYMFGEGTLYIQLKQGIISYGPGEQLGSIQSNDGIHYYYLDQFSSYNIYEDGKLIAPEQTISCMKGKGEASIYKLNAEKDLMAYDKSFESKDAMIQVSIADNEGKSKWLDDATYDPYKVLELIQSYEEIFPEEESIRVNNERQFIYFARAESRFNKKYGCFQEDAYSINLLLDKNNYGILEVQNSIDDSNIKYYQLNEKQIEEFISIVNSSKITN